MSKKPSYYKVVIENETYNILAYTVRVKVDVESLLKRYNDNLNTLVQIVPEAIPSTKRHFILALYYTLRNHIRGKGVAKSPHLEVLLYLFGTRQISKVLEVLSKFKHVDRYMLVLASKGNPEDIVSLMVKRGEIKVLKTNNGVNLNCELCDFSKEELESFYGEKDEIIEKASILKSLMLTTKL